MALRRILAAQKDALLAWAAEALLIPTLALTHSERGSIRRCGTGYDNGVHRSRLRMLTPLDQVSTKKGEPGRRPTRLCHYSTVPACAPH